MRNASIMVATGFLALSLSACAVHEDYYEPSAPAGYFGRDGCADLVNRGMYFMTELPDTQRAIVAAVFAHSVAGPQVDISVFKQMRYVSHDYWGFRGWDEFVKAEDAKVAALEAWEHEPTIFRFSSDRVEVTWQNGGHASYPISGLRARDGAFETSGAFVGQHFSIPNASLTGDWFVVTLPKVIVDGATLSPPPVRFTHRVTTEYSYTINC